MSSNINSDDTVDKHVNNKNCVQNRTVSLNYSSTTAMEYSVGISHPLITPLMKNVPHQKGLHKKDMLVEINLGLVGKGSCKVEVN